MSENSITVFEHPQFGEVRTVEIDGEPWFVAADVCRALDLSNPTMALGRLDEDERSKLSIGRQGETGIVNEPGLYGLVLGSRKEEAKSFKRWVKHDVLPAIRKTGSYTAEPPKPMTLAEQLLQYAQVAVEQERKVNALAARMDAQQQTLEKAVSVFSLPTVEVEHWRDEMNTHVSRICETYGLSQQVFRGDTYAELEEQANVILSSRVKRKQDRMKKAGAKARERAAVTKLFVISEDEKLRHMYEAIVRKHESQLCVQSSRPPRAS